MSDKRKRRYFEDGELFEDDLVIFEEDERRRKPREDSHPYRDSARDDYDPRYDTRAKRKNDFDEDDTDDPRYTDRRYDDRYDDHHYHDRRFRPMAHWMDDDDDDDDRKRYYKDGEKYDKKRYKKRKGLLGFLEEIFDIFD